MTPEKVTFYIYAESSAEVKQLQEILYNFIDTNYRKGVLVTAERLTALLENFGDNPFISKLLNGNKTN